MASDPNTSTAMNFDDKKQQMTDKLQKRKDERDAKLTRRKADKDSVSSEQESSKHFNERFVKERIFIENELSNLHQQGDGASKNNMVVTFDSLSERLQKLQSFVTECTSFLTAHEITRAQSNLSQLQNNIQKKRDEILPKKKFAFKKKVEHKPKPKPVISESDDEDKNNSNQDDLMVELAECKFVDRANKILKKSPDEINNKDVALANLTSCTVKLFGAPSAIHVSKLNNCYIFTGPVSGSIFIRDCINCIFVSPCQQLRIHTTTLTSFYIHVTTKAIIEDCNTLMFAPYNWSYPGLDEHYIMSGLNRSINNWNDIDDFNWLAVDASPNWSLLPEDERVKDWNE